MWEKLTSYFKKHRKFLVGTAAAFLFFCFLVIGPLFVEAMITLSAQRNLEIQQRNSAIETAILNNDYATWSSLVSDTNLKAKVNAGNFSEFVNAYRLLQQGKVEEADLIKKQLVLKQDFAATAAKSQAIETAIRNNDYAAWRTAVGPGIEPAVTIDNFHTYASSYWLIMKGNMSGADRIKRNVGVKPTIGGVNYDSSR